MTDRTEIAPDSEHVEEGDAPAVPREVRPRPRFRRLLNVFNAGIVLLALATPLSYRPARYSWRFDLFTHFVEPACAFAAVAASVFWLRGKKVWAGFFCLLALYQLALCLQFSGANPVPPDPASSDRLRIMVANLLDDNDAYDLIAGTVRLEKPEIVGFVEFSHHHAEGLKTLKLTDEYPFRYELPYGSRGLALWFKKKPTAVRNAVTYIRGGNPVIVATFEFAGRPVKIWLVHPPNPIGGRRGSATPDLLAIGKNVGERTGTRIVMGDLNRTEGSPHFNDFVKLTGLRDTRYGFGRQPTWPDWSSYRIPIDHVLVSDDLAVANRRVGPYVGSDHLPVIIDLAPSSIKPDANPSANITAKAAESSPTR